MNNNDIPRKIIDITGVELTPGELPFVLATESKALNAVATNATTFCFVSPDLIQKAKQLTKQKSPRPYYDKSNAKALLTFSYQKPMQLPSGR
ncbi:MAG: hypothetical protein E7663_04560 [Ruminococcaceae bacterium]|nr:hypothetical protein [Oscillospiraceae bacterium]